MRRGCVLMPLPSAIIDAPARPLAESNEPMCLGLSLSCDFQMNMGHMLIGARAGALHVSVASIVVRMASAHGSSPSATTT